MNEEKYVAKMPQSLTLEDRRRLSVTGVEDVDSFDDKTVVIKTVQGQLTVYGSGMKMGKFNVATGELSLEGFYFSFFIEGCYVWVFRCEITVTDSAYYEYSRTYRYKEQEHTYSNTCHKGRGVLFLGYSE